jgi:thioredoxin 1
MSIELTRAEVDSTPGLLLLEFGAEWCHYCQAIQADLLRSLEQYPQVRHIKIEDGRRQPLGRSFRVKLWPTLVLLRDGQVIRQLTRPGPEEICVAIAELATS